ncbi:hypothetical protein ACLI1A_03265 [Flavobacterium sp. RHBU_3]|uniref:hypothetical protein n=1 Tax=Flavobacterium sp. RHBU_3 TaxID=3391184 RepID=UPI003984F541
MKKSGFDGVTKLITILYLDGEYIDEVAIEDLNDRERSGQRLLTMRLPLNDGTDEFYRGESVYRALLGHQEKLTPGKHKIRIEQFPLTSYGLGHRVKFKPMAVGEIELIVPATDIKVSEGDCLPAKKLNDPKLETEAMKAVKSYFKDGAPNAYKIILTENDMTVVRDEYGNIIRKAFFATVVYKKGNEVWYENHVFEKMWDGLEYLPLRVSSSKTIGDYTAKEGRKVNAACLKYLK